MSSNILKTVVEKIDPTAIIKIEGPFNDFQAKEISNIIDDLLGKRFIHFIINFEKSNELNSFGVSVLIDIINRPVLKLSPRILTEPLIDASTVTVFVYHYLL